MQNELRNRARRLLGFDLAALSDSGWFTDTWLETVFREAPRNFDRAFDRWRELYRTALRQLTEAQTARRRARQRDDQEQARRREDEAERQLNLLRQTDTNREESDFYPYRYLASEGFLPGYNFPALPIRAWIPRDQGEFISRPRILALREFGPNNVLYHEGAKWEIVSLQLPPGGLEERRTQKRFCKSCGTFCDTTLDWHQGAEVTAAKSKFEHPFRKVASLGPGGMPVQDDLVRRIVTAARPRKLRFAFSR